MTAASITQALLVSTILLHKLAAQVDPQTVAPQVATPSTTSLHISLPVDLQPHRIVYRHFLRQVAEFGHKAETIEAAGGDPGTFRNFLPKQTGVSSAMATYITQLAFQYEQELSGNQARVKQVVSAFRQAHKDGIDPDNPPPIPDPALQALTVERNKITESYVKRLQELLGETAFERFDDKVRSNVVSGPKSGFDSAAPESAE